jgi:3-oxoacyl-(acyl-carrier-protein) synthase
MNTDEILAAYKEMSSAYHAETDKKKALATYNAAYEGLLQDSGMDREVFGYLLAHGSLPIEENPHEKTQ